MADPATREEARRRAQQALRDGPLYLDTETTGLDSTAEIVEICILTARGQVAFESLVRPDGGIPPGATAVHGITEDMVRGAPRWPEVWTRVERVLGHRRVGIYNASYDVRMVQQANQRHGLQRPAPTAHAFCIMQLYARWLGELSEKRSGPGQYRWHKLEAAARQCGVSVAGAHRARADAATARAVLHYIAGVSR
jgi:DNA polymerase-3 subunit epsilon